MHGLGVTILCVLNQKHHEEGDDCRSGVDDQLPRVREMKRRSGDKPDENDKNGPAKRPGAASRVDERCAKQRNASLTTQKISRSFSFFFLSFAPVVFAMLTSLSHATPDLRAPTAWFGNSHAQTALISPMF